MRKFKNFNWDYEEEEPRLPLLNYIFINKKFYNFLLKNKILDNYMNNLTNSNNTYFDDYMTYKVFFKNEYLYFESPFNWASSPEGYFFWDKINDKWLNEIY